MSPMLQPKYSQILLRTAIDTSSSRRRVVIVFGEISAALHKSALLIFYRSAASAVCCNWLTAWLLYPPHIYVFVSLPVLMNTVYHIFSLFAIHFRWFLHMSRLFEVEFRNLLRNMICKNYSICPSRSSAPLLSTKVFWKRQHKSNYRGERLILTDNTTLNAGNISAISDKVSVSKPLATAAVSLSGVSLLWNIVSLVAAIVRKKKLI